MSGDVPAPPPLARGEIHVWLASLERPAGLVLRDLLSPDERARADRLRHATACDEFIAARGLLRLILAGYAGSPPQALRFVYGANGKPALGGKARLSFNLAHSGGLLLVAVAGDRDVGVDVERIRRDLPWRRLARRFFAPAEADALDALPDEAGRRAFFVCWARKEAFVKARGGRLPRDLRDFAVSVGREEAAPSIETYTDTAEGERWAVRDVEAGEGFAAAVAAGGSAWTVRRLEWTRA